MNDTTGAVVRATNREELAAVFDENPGGAFISIKGYRPVSADGEVADYQLRSGIKYPNVVADSIAQLKDIMAGKGVPSLHVKCMTWQNPDKTFSNRKSKERVLVTFEKSYLVADRAFQEAAAEVLEALENPGKPTTEYDKEAKGLYSLDGTSFYIRDCLVIEKKILVHGTRNVKATHPDTALRDAIRRLLPVGNYRTFKLDGEFDAVMINHDKVVSG